MRKFAVSMAGLVVALALLVFGRSAAAAPDLQHPRFTASLTGPAEVPGPVDQDGSGTAAVAFQAANDVCFTIRVSNVTLPAAAAHIHRGAPGVAGPVVVSLLPPAANGRVDGCTSGDVDVLNEIRANPASFYVNVHTSDFPQGAVRGQLSMLAQTMPSAGQSDMYLPLALAIAGLILLAGIGLRLSTRRHAG